MPLTGGCKVQIQNADGSAYNGSGWGPTLDDVGGVLPPPPPAPVAWADVSNKPNFGTASLAATGDFATAAQGTLAGTATQPAALAIALATKQDAGSYATGAQGALAATAVQPAGLTKAAVGLGNCDNTADLSKPISTATQTALNAKAALPTVSATSATTGTMTVAMGDGVRTITPTGACTFNASGGVAGDRCTFAITTAGSSSFVLTWGTNFRKVGTLATGTTAARFFSVTFVCINGTVWQEVARTAVQT